MGLAPSLYRRTLVAVIVGLMLTTGVASAEGRFVPQNPDGDAPGTVLLSLYTMDVAGEPVPLMMTRTPDGKVCDGYVRSVERQDDGYVAIALGQICHRQE